MKIKTKIQLFSSLFMLLLLLLINTSVYYLFYKISADNELEQLTDQTNRISETLTANPDIPHTELLHAFLPANGMIRVFQENGDQVIPILTKKDEYRSLHGEFSSAESRKIVSGETKEKIAVISKPIIWNDGKVVTLQVSKHLITLEKTMKTLFYVLIVASVFMLIPTFIAGTLLSRFLLRPIKGLIQTMRENIKQSTWQKMNVQDRSHDELNEMEKTFNDMIDQLKDNYEKQAIFVSDASHELRTPISIVKSYAQLLKRRGKDHPDLFDESVEALDSEADRMQKLVEQMLLLAKNENEVFSEIVILDEVCAETVATFIGAYNRNITLEKQPDHLLVNGNKDQLQQIIYILIDNALKYSEDDIKLVLVEKNKEAILQVTDYGQGIPNSDLPHLFDRFYRLDKARSRDTGGTGLGLAIAKSIAEAHQGELTVASKLDEGTTFTLTLPIIKED